jgi:soluble P-type ATPase
MPELRAGDRIDLMPRGEPWRIRQVLPQRLRLSSATLLNNHTLQQQLLNASLHLAWIHAVRINTLAGSLVIVHTGRRPLRRKQLQALLHLAVQHEHPQSLELTPRASRSALWRLSGTTGVLAGVALLELPVWPGLVLFLALCYAPLAKRCLQNLGQPQPAGSWLDLFWFTSLLAQGNPTAVLLEWTLETANQVFKAWTPSPSFAEAFDEQLQQRLTALRFTVRQSDGSWQQQPFATLTAGDRLRLGPGAPLPAHALVMAGAALVSSRWRDGDPRLLSARAFQQLPFGTSLVEGELEVRLVRSPERDPERRALQRLLHELQHRAGRDRRASLLKRAQQWHQASVPYLLLAGATLLAVGPHGSAGALMQFDPASDWQLTASLTYGNAQRDLLWQGVLLRRPEAIDALAHCRRLLVSEAVVLNSSSWRLGGIHALPFLISSEELIQAVAGFRCQQKPHGLHALRSVLEAEDLLPAVVEAIQPLGHEGLQGRIHGVLHQLGGAAMLRQLGLRAPAELITPPSETLLYLVQQGEVVGAVGFDLQLSRPLLQGLRQLQRVGWQLHFLAESHSELMERLATRLHKPAASIHTAANHVDRSRWLNGWRARGEPIAMLGCSAIDGLSLAQADLSIELLSREHGLSSENADLVLRPEAIGSLVACQAIAWEAAQRHRRNLALVLAPHISVVLLNLLLPVNPVLAVLAVDLPVLLAELGRIGGGQDAVEKPTKKPRRSGAC